MLLQLDSCLKMSSWRGKLMKMRPLFVLLTIRLLGVGFAACGGTGKSSRFVSQDASTAVATGGALAAPASHVPATGDHLEGDGDGDDGGHPHNDYDDHRIRDYGHAASTAEVRAVTTLVKRYYTAAAADDGTVACSLIYSRFTKNPGFTDAIPSAYVPVPGSAVLRGKSCAQVASLLFGLDHQQLAEEVTVQMTSLRIDGIHGLALLGFKSTPERWIPVDRESNAWKIGAFLDNEVP
jgi:hypothetical protein